MNRQGLKRFAAVLACGVFLGCFGGAGVLAQTSAPNPVLAEWQQLTNVQEMLRINQQFQAQLRATELTLDQSLTNSQELLQLNQQLQARLRATELTLDQSLTNAQELLRLNQQLQAQLQTSRFAFQQNQREAHAAAAQNLEAMSTLLSGIERNLMVCRKRELDQLQSGNQSILVAAGGVVGAGLLVIALVAFLHWRVFNSLAASLVACAQGKGHAVASASSSETSLAPGGQAGQSAARLPDAIGRLEKRVIELEQTAQTPPLRAGKTAVAPAAAAPPAAAEPTTRADPESHIVILLGKGQSLLNLDQEEEAIACFDQILRLEPNHAEALVKKATALEQLDRLEEAIAGYDRAIAANPLLTIAYLRKGGICNRLARYAEALKSYEQALQAQGQSHPV